MLNNKLKFPLFLLLFSAFLFSCGGDAKKSANSNNAPVVKKGVAPVADKEIAVIETDFGTIKMELYSNIAPKMVEQFKQLAKEGVYNGTIFHRVNDSVIQGGDPFSKDSNPANDGMGKSDKPNVEAEFSDIPYDTGIVGAARSTDFNSANAQFFITLKRQPVFDNKYTIFGKVIEGMTTAQIIAGAPREVERPSEPIHIKSISIQPK
jgi:peptidyl-prolyl cis-trans isomerase B (cyclophilin B)